MLLMKKLKKIHKMNYILLLILEILIIKKNLLKLFMMN